MLRRANSTGSIRRLLPIVCAAAVALGVLVSTVHARVYVYDPADNGNDQDTYAVAQTPIATPPGGVATFLNVPFTVPAPGPGSNQCSNQLLVAMLAWYNPVNGAGGNTVSDGRIMVDWYFAGYPGSSESFSSAYYKGCTPENDDIKKCTAIWALPFPTAGSSTSDNALVRFQLDQSAPAVPAHEMVAGVTLACNVDLSDFPSSAIIGGNGGSAQTTRNPAQTGYTVDGAMCFDMLVVPNTYSGNTITHQPAQISPAAPTLPEARYFMAEFWGWPPNPQSPPHSSSAANLHSTNTMCTHATRIASRLNQTFVFGFPTQQVTLYQADPVAVPGQITMMCVGPKEITEAELADVTAEVADFRDTSNGVMIRWSTSQEADTLGFNLYRQDGAHDRKLVNPGLIAGSAIRYPGIELEAGYSYAWFDPNGKADSRYFIEEVDLDGNRDSLGPYTVTSGKAATTDLELSPTLAEVGRQIATRAADATTVRFERSTEISPPAGSKSGSQRDQTDPFESPVASQPAAKLLVTEDGWYRVSYDELVAAGMSFPPKTSTSQLQLWAEGVQAALRVVNDTDGVFDNGDVLEFFGVTTETQYANGRYYWLVAGSSPGARVRVELSGASNASTVDVREAVSIEQNLIYQAGADNGEEENFFGQLVMNGQPPAMHTIPIPHPSLSPTTPATLDVVAYGALDRTQDIDVAINGTPVGGFSIESAGVHNARLTVPPGALHDGDNSITLTHAGGTGVSFVDSLTVRYDRVSIAANNRADLLLGQKQGRTPLRIEGFSNNRVRVFDVTSPLRPVELQTRAVASANGWAVDARPVYQLMGSLGRRPYRLFATTDDRVLHPEIVINAPSSLAGADGADMVILANAALIPELDPLVELRESQRLRVKLIDIQDVYDEFSAGMKSPDAIRDFLAHASQSWRPSPRFVLLVGDGSYDPKDYLGLTSDLVPTKLVFVRGFETASDTWFLPTDTRDQIAIGRLPVSTTEQTRAVVQKLVSYASSGPIMDRAVLVADDPLGENFVHLNRTFGDAMRIATDYVDVPAVGSTQARADVLEAFSNGSPLIHFSGHGATYKWRGNLLTISDEGSLQNAGRPAFISALTCLNGAFQEVQSLGEVMVRDPNGGAIAMVSSTSTHDTSEQQAASAVLLQSIASGSETFGEAFAKSLDEDSPDIRVTTVFLGDPATRIRR